MCISGVILFYWPTHAAAAPHRHCRPSALPYCRVTSSQYIQSNCFYNLAPSNISVLNSARLIIIIIILLPFVLLSKSIHGPLAREYRILDKCFLEDCNSQLLVSECILAFVNFPIPHKTFCCSPPPLQPAPPFQDLELKTFCLTQSSASWSASYACHEFIQEDVKVVTSKTLSQLFVLKLQTN